MAALSQKHILVKIIAIFVLSFLSLVAIAATYPIPAAGSDIIGEMKIITAKRGQSLTDIGSEYGVGYHEITQANPSLPVNQQLQGGEQVIVPTEYILPPFHKGIVINIPELRLYYFTPDGKSVITYPVGLGRMEWRTPLTETSIIKKEVNPVWHVPKSIHDDVLTHLGIDLPTAIPPGPNDPLGHFAMFLGVKGYLIHGNDQSWSIGKFVSSGCIRMHNNDVQHLFMLVKVGTPVHIINYAYKAGWRDGQLYLESQEPIQLNQPVSSIYQPTVQQVIAQAISINPYVQINWNKVNDIAIREHGMPIAISEPVQSSAEVANL